MNPAFTAPLLRPALPEIILALGAMALVLVGAYRGERSTRLVNLLALGLIALALVAVLALPAGRLTTFSGSFVVDGFAKFMKVLTLLGSGAAIVLSSDYLRREGIDRFEFGILIVLSSVGMLIMISANDLIALYLGLELQSLAAYVIASFHRDNLRSTEAGLKYFVLGALSSGMLLYGASLVYGFTGTVSFEGIAAALHGNVGIGIVLGVVFVAAGVAFKMSAAPFHMWTPDVYEGAPTPVTAFFASAPKVAAIALLARVLLGPFGDLVAQWQQVIVLVSLGSMILGAFAAIGQRNLKRLMAYSSIGHVGYALMGLAVGSDIGLRGLLVYMAIYVFMNLGTFAVLVSMRREGKSVEGIDDLAGLGRTDPVTAMWMAVFMFSMAGIPPLAGFFGKLYVFLAAVQGGFWTLAVVGVLTSVVSAYYYLRIVKVMYFDAPVGSLDRAPTSLTMVMAGTGLFTALFALWPAPMLAAAQAAAAALLG
jgi:NADH-quinone oxidoreductase subunit N